MLQDKRYTYICYFTTEHFFVQKSSRTGQFYFLTVFGTDEQASLANNSVVKRNSAIFIDFTGDSFPELCEF